MSSMNDLISRVLLPSTVEDLKRRLDAGRESGWYESNTSANSNCFQPKKKRLSSEKSDDHKKSHSSSKDGQNAFCKEINNKFSHITENSTYVNTSNGENLSWDNLNKVIKDKVQCPDCGKVFFNEVKLPENFLKIYSNSIANNDNNVANTQPTILKNVPSLPSATEPQRYECYICDRVFSQKENYAKHLKKHLNSAASSSKNKCEICSKSFSNQTALFNHFLEHKSNTCGKCGKSFPDKWKYERHYKTHLHKCQLCEKLFVKKCYLKKHLATSHGVYDLEPNEKQNQPKIINSNNCKMIVSVKPEVNEESNAFVLIKSEVPAIENISNEMAIVPYVAKPAVADYKNLCNICGKSFKDKWKLKQHLVIHSGERAWACNFCTQRFYFKYGLSRHVKNVHLAKEQQVFDVCEAVKKDNVKQE
ncbi:zinc finger protein 454 [Parasteatoda tepidariorum]|uniref:zinc finger protein 454 n=1 Tax=Parasteatoda tepidariorum TaxID=114398 RepID=UPI00077F887E|nr:zinc finger protein 28-like [Parasteatoda tepidariorum]XP_042912458.1 zinc finger protein 28-like [Parasteatoda tepidariorum]XP_042912459.1 zinc finger protein 28-like [Parasteatoda tepidariorum]XP_042912460.1 zinc finger protein 28-like [Parasteatoda tepidariorum]